MPHPTSWRSILIFSTSLVEALLVPISIQRATIEVSPGMRIVRGALSLTGVWFYQNVTCPQIPAKPLDIKNQLFLNCYQSAHRHTEACRPNFATYCRALASYLACVPDQAVRPEHVPAKSTVWTKEIWSDSLLIAFGTHSLTQQSKVTHSGYFRIARAATIYLSSLLISFK
jgi:hypothetical protein